MIKVSYNYSNSFADPMGPWVCSQILGFNVDGVNKYEERRSKSSRKSKSSASPGKSRFFNKLFGKLNEKALRLARGDKRKRNYDKPSLFTLGSIFHMVSEKDWVWGTGVNPIWQRTVPLRDQPFIHAVRGPLTKHYLERKYHWELPEVFGDPGVLISHFYVPRKLPKKNQVLVLLQHNDELYEVEKYIGNSCAITRCQRDQSTRLNFFEVADLIFNSEYVISSSLHAIIFAEAFGVPARWLRNPYLPSVETESDFKYNDYYLSTEREPYQFATTVEAALEQGGLMVDRKIIENLQKNLLECFPSSLFKNDDVSGF